MSQEAVKKAEEPIGDDNLDRRTLFVRSLPFEATTEQLSEYFSQFVPVKHAVVVNDDNQKSRGFGFVSFTEDEDTLTALVESKKVKFQNRFLRVDMAKRRDRKNKDREAPVIKKEFVPVEKRRARLIIRNMPWSCKDPLTLKHLFSKYGAVFDAYIPKKSGGQMRGFAFVTMMKQAAAEKAVKESKGLKIDGREVAVDLALEKSKWELVKDDDKDDEDEEEEEEEEEEDEEEEEEEDDEEDDDEDKTKVGKSKSKKDQEDDDDEDEEDEEDEEFDKLNEINSDDEVEEEEEEAPKNRQEAYAVFVRNIPYDADEESLKEHFSTFGAVKYALPVKDRETGLARGSAFVAFYSEDAYNDCLAEAPTTASTSVLIADDVASAYVYQGRILSISPAVDRESAGRLADRNSEKRQEALGKGAADKDKRSLFLLNEGRITSNSKLAQLITKNDLEMREKSYNLRVQQLNKNPTLHLSMTRLAVRNLPRSMNAKALKALGRKAVVQFATEVKEEKRQPLSKEELNRSIKLKHEMNEFLTKSGIEEGESKARKSKLKGVVKQAKVVLEIKGSGETGRSRGYGFIEFRDHKAALMGLRWLNAHEVCIEEILEGLTDEERKLAEMEGLSKRRLICEFAVENAQVVKRRRERVFYARSRDHDDEKKGKGKGKRSRDNDSAEEPDKKKSKKKGPKGNLNKGPKGDKPEEANKSGLSSEMKQIIGAKRKRRKGKN